MKPRDWANDFSTNAVNLEDQEVTDTNTDVLYKFILGKKVQNQSHKV